MGVRFHLNPRIEGLPRPLTLWRQEITDPSYHFIGAGRPHTYCVFQYTLSGCGCFRYHDQTWELPPGTGFLCDIQDPAYAYYLGEHPRWEFLFLQIGAPATHAMVRALVDQCGPVFELSLKHQLILRYRSWLESDFDGVLDAAAGMAVVHELLAALLGSAQGSAASDNVHLTTALQLISQDVSRPLDASQLAQALGISREHLTRLFRQHLNQSPYAYITENRVHHVAFALRHGEASIAELAAAHGFSSPEVMCKVFKRVMGRTPTQYRET